MTDTLMTSQLMAPLYASTAMRDIMSDCLAKMIRQTQHSLIVTSRPQQANTRT